MDGYKTIATVFNGGNVTIPEGICKAMELKDGDLVEITIKRVGEEAEVSSVTWEVPSKALRGDRGFKPGMY